MKNVALEIKKKKTRGTEQTQLRLISIRNWCWEKSLPRRGSRAGREKEGVTRKAVKGGWEEGIHCASAPRRRWRERGEALWEEIMAEDFSEVIKCTDSQVKTTLREKTTLN